MLTHSSIFVLPACLLLSAGLTHAQSTPAAPAAPAPAPASTTTPAPAAEPVLAREERADGLVVEDLKLGSGRTYDATAKGLFAQYRAMIKGKGEEFDSSAKRRGQPIYFESASLLDGLQKGLIGMKMGGKRRITIPAGLAFGAEEVKDRAGKVIIPANSDLVYEIELDNIFSVIDNTPGTGEEAKNDAVIEVYYTGTLAIDGKQFDSNIGQPNPMRSPLGNLVAGWKLGIPGMKVGGKRTLIIPWQLGYGETGSGEKIPPRSDLVFDIELKGVAPAPQAMPIGGPGSPMMVPVPGSKQLTPVPAPERTN